MTLALQADVQKTIHSVFTNQPEPVITYLLEGATQAINTYVDRQLEEDTYTNELYDVAWGRTLIQLRQYPVTAVTAVIENLVALVEGTSYQFYSNGMLARISGRLERRWQNGRKIVDVSYTAGYAAADVPHDIRNICAAIVARHFEAGAAYAATPTATGNVTSVQLDGSDSIGYADDPNMASIGYVEMLTMEEMTALSRYRKRMVL